MKLQPGGHLVRGLAPDGSYRFVATVCTVAVRDAIRRHGVEGLSTVVLGRAAATSLCLATLTKGGERVTLQINGDGPLGSVLADARDTGDMRAYIRGDLSQPAPGDPGERPAVGALVGLRGVVTLIRDLGLRENYRGQGELVDGEIDSDVERYLTVSEQVDSALVADVVLDSSGGVRAAAAVLVQALPVADGETVGDTIEAVRAAMRTHVVHRLLASARADHMDAAMLVAAVVPEGVASILEAHAVRFHCPCDADRVRGALATLGPADLEALVEEQGEAQVICEFCNELYTLTADEVRTFAARLRSALN